METCLDEILIDIDWRINELATIKSIPIRYNFRQNHKDIYIKYLVPSIYSIWEGFVKSCFTIYSNYLNTLSIPRTEITNSLLTHIVDSECNLNNPRNSFESKRRLVELLDSLFTDTITIKPSIPTESNVNLKVLNAVFERFCISKIDEKYERGLNKLLRFRNTIAHGENSLQVSMDNIVEFVSLIENLMIDTVINIEQSANSQKYKKLIIS